MTTSGRIGAPPAGAPRPELGDPVERVRRSLVTIRAGVRGGSGFVALANGAVLTSLEAIGGATEVTIELGARRVAGRVLAAHVALDVALVLPRDPLGATPLRRAPAARLGQSVWALAQAPGDPASTWHGAIACTERARGKAKLLELSPAPAPHARGAPLLDAEGRLVGVVGERGLACPIAALEAELAACDRPASQLATRAPVLRCPECDEPIAASMEACLACGAALPFAGEATPDAGPHRLVRELLAAAGVGGDVRFDGRAYRFAHRAPNGPGQNTVLTASLDASGTRISVRAPIARLPRAHHEALYRLLLTLNDATSGPMRLGLEGDVVVLVATEPLAHAREQDPTALFADVVAHASHYRRALAEAYGAEPVIDG